MNPPMKVCLTIYNLFFTFQKIQYSDHQSQFAFLQVMSQRASQKITYHCKNSVAWLDEKMNSHDKSIKLLALNGYEYSKDGHTNAQPKVISDECKVGNVIYTADSMKGDNLPKYHISTLRWRGMMACLMFKRYNLEII